jgi:hypothetical protein
MFCNTDLLINIAAILSVVSLVGFFFLYVLPRSWITDAKSEYGQSLLRGQPPVWAWLNSKGRVIQVVSYSSAFIVFIIVSIGVYYEIYVSCS